MLTHVGHLTVQRDALSFEFIQRVTICRPGLFIKRLNQLSIWLGWKLTSFITYNSVVIFRSKSLPEARCGILSAFFVLKSLRFECSLYMFTLHLVANNEIKLAPVLTNHFNAETLDFRIISLKSAHFNWKNQSQVHPKVIFDLRCLQQILRLLTHMCR